VAKEIRILIAVVGLGLAGLVLLVKFTDVCQLQAVTLNGQAVPQWSSLGLNPNRNLFRQPVDSVAKAMLAQSGIVHVDIKYQLPNGLSITTNDLAPVCYVLDEFSGTMYGVDRTGRTVLLEQSSIDWERPIITGVRVRGAHDFTSDARVSMLIPQLNRLQSEFPDLFRLTEEINLSHPDYVRISISGLRYSLKLPCETLADRFADFRRFMNRFKPATAGVSTFDLTYDDMIIRVGSIGEKKKPVVDTSSVNDVAEIRDDAVPETSAAPVETKPVLAKPILAKAAPTSKKLKPATITKGAAKVNAPMSPSSSKKLSAPHKSVSPKAGAVTKSGNKSKIPSTTKPVKPKGTRKTS
jgi:hypothetical protein